MTPSQRKDRDSNPGTPQGGQRFSRPPRSTTPASFHLSKNECKSTTFFRIGKVFLISLFLMVVIQCFIFLFYFYYKVVFGNNGVLEFCFCLFENQFWLTITCTNVG